MIYIAYIVYVCIHTHIHTYVICMGIALKPKPSSKPLLHSESAWRLMGLVLLISTRFSLQGSFKGDIGPFKGYSCSMLGFWISFQGP